MLRYQPLVCQTEADSMPAVFQFERAAKEDKSLQMSLRRTLISYQDGRRTLIVAALVGGLRRPFFIDFD